MDAVPLPPSIDHPSSNSVDCSPSFRTAPCSWYLFPPSLSSRLFYHISPRNLLSLLPVPASFSPVSLFNLFFSTKSFLFPFGNFWKSNPLIGTIFTVTVFCHLEHGWIGHWSITYNKGYNNWLISSVVSAPVSDCCIKKNKVFGRV